MTENERKAILGKTEVKEMYYRLDDIKYTTVSKARTLSGIEDLDYNTSGFEMGCITIWTGLTNAGKTTVMTMIAKKTIEQGERIFFFNGEQTKEDFKNNLYIQASGKKDLIRKQYRNSIVYDTFVKEEKARELEKIYGNKIYIYNNEVERDINSLLYAMEELRKEQKIRVFFLDNFMQIDIKSDNVFQEQTNIMEKLRTFAVNKKVHIHLVAHPRKTERFQVRLAEYDILGSSNLSNKAYNIISIMRMDKIRNDNKEKEKLEKELLNLDYDLNTVDTVLEIIKTKGQNFKTSLVGLQYDRELRTFTPSRKLYNEEKEKIKYNYENSSKEKLPWQI